MTDGQRQPHAAQPHDHAPPERFDRAFWDDRYRSASSLWSGRPNVHLVSEASGLRPGTALDAGAGEGADAIWLAGRGWRVTAVDISGVALERAAAHARAAARAGDAGAAADAAAGQAAGRIEWLCRDLITWQPPEGAYDLVTAQYLQLPPASRGPLFRALAAAVASGGSLLIVGHHPSDMGTTMPRPAMPELFFTGDDIAALAGGAGWEIATNVAAPRPATDPEGRAVTVHDTVFRARRSTHPSTPRHA